MTEGSDAATVVAVFLLTAAIVFAAGAVSPLASHSPVEGVDDVGNGLSPGNTTVPAGAGGGGGSPPGAPAAGGNLSVSESVATVFGSLLETVLGSNVSIGGAPFGAPSSGGSGSSGSMPDAGNASIGSGNVSIDSGNVSLDTGNASVNASGGNGGQPTTATPQDDEESTGPLGGSNAKRLGVVILAVAGLLLGVYLYRSDEGIVEALRALPQAVRAACVNLVLAISDAVEAAVRRLAAARSVLEVPGIVLAGIVHALHSLRRDLAAAVPFVGGAADAAGAGVGVPEDADAPPARQQIRAAWRGVVDAVAPGRARTSTPGEVERAAIDRGLPGDAVRTVADSFRAVEYGGRTPREQLEAATDAAATIEDHLDGATDGASGPGDDDTPGDTAGEGS